MPHRSTVPPDAPWLTSALRRLLVCGALLTMACAHGAPQINPKAVRFQAEGANALTRGDLDRAAGLFSLALEYEPRMAEARNGLGLVAMARGDKAAAEEQFKIALQFNEELAEAHHNLGEINLDRDEVEDALTRFKQALAIDPGYWPSRLKAGEALIRLGRPEEARWELVKLTEVQPQNAAAQAYYALVLAQLNRIAAAEAAAQKALALDPNLGAAHRARAVILTRRKDLAGAAEEYRAVLKSNPASVDDRVGLVRSLIGSGRLDDADSEIMSLEKLAPARPEVSYLRAYLALNRQDLQTAINYSVRALKLKPRYPEARMVLAEALIRTGQDAEGRHQLKIFLEEAPPALDLERRLANQFLAR